MIVSSIVWLRASFGIVFRLKFCFAKWKLSGHDFYFGGKNMEMSCQKSHAKSRSMLRPSNFGYKRGAFLDGLLFCKKLINHAVSGACSLRSLFVGSGVCRLADWSADLF
jgi:hypothetical protein